MGLATPVSRRKRTDVNDLEILSKNVFPPAGIDNCPVTLESGDGFTSHCGIISDLGQRLEHVTWQFCPLLGGCVARSCADLSP